MVVNNRQQKNPITGACVPLAVLQDTSSWIVEEIKVKSIQEKHNGEEPKPGATFDNLSYDHLLSVLCHGTV
jgi:hypothetical protein